MIVKQLSELLPTLGTRVALVHDKEHHIVNEKFLKSLGLHVVPFGKEKTDILDNVFTDIILFTDPTAEHNNYPVPTTSVQVYLYKPEHMFNCIQSFVYNGKDFDRILSNDPEFSEPATAGHNSYFYEQLINCLPSLEPYKNNIALIYAGATMEHAMYARDPVSVKNEIEQYLKRDYKHIIFWCAEEAFNPGGFCVLQRVADRFADVDVEFYYATSGLNGPEIYQEYADRFNFKKHINILAFTRFEEVGKSVLIHLSRELENALQKPYSVKNRPHKYLNFNRMPRFHRKLFMAMMEQKQLIDMGLNSFDIREDISTGDPKVDDTTFTTEYLSQYNAQHLTDSYNKFLTRLPLQLNRTTERENPTELDESDVMYYNTSYFSVVSETEYSVHDKTSLEKFPSIFYSEKIYKPLMMKHPFILIGFPGSLNYLRKLGYQTFAPYIDESYDEITDDYERMTRIVTEIERLCYLSNEDWVKLQTDLQSVVTHNYNWVMSEKNLCVNPDVLNKFNSE